MPANGDVLAIDTGASAQELVRAAETLEYGAGAVMVAGLVVLRRTPVYLVCEVIDPAPSAHRCAHEYEVLVENAQRALEASGLRDILPGLPRNWLVVDNSAADVVELWRAP